MKKLLTISIFLVSLCINTTNSYSQLLWDIAKHNKDNLIIATLFTAPTVRDYLTDSIELDKAVSLCKQTGVTKVYIESFRGGYYANREMLVHVKDRFLNEGFTVSGCVTTTRIKKDGIGGWNKTPCYTNSETPEELQRIFEFTASIFDEIMIDDFLFTECTCEECITARGDQSWSKYRSDLMVKMSREHILKPAKDVNPSAKVIIKYPLWYDHFQERGFDVIRESQDFDLIYVGTETRDYDYAIRQSGEVQYGAYFNMRWLGSIGGDKTSGGWFDALGTTPNTYLEQARQTVLADAKELLLFCYKSFISEKNKFNGWEGTGIADVEAFRRELPGLFELARIVNGKSIKGIHMPKPPNSEPFEEPYIYSILGMLGLPLVPANKISNEIESGIFTVHMLKEPGFSEILKGILELGNPIIITDGLSKRLTNQELLEHENLTILRVDGNPKNLLKLTRDELNPIRNRLLKPIGIQLDAPNKVAFYLFGDNYFVLENFNNEIINVTLDYERISDVQKVLMLPESGTAEITHTNNSVRITNISPRTLVAFEYH